MPSERINFFVRGLFLLLLSTPFFAYGSVTDGTIDGTNKYAHGYESNVGLINFGLSAGNVHVTDTALTGYAWGENIGWINLAPTYGGVTNNGQGVLGGYAWGELAGWINLAPTQGGVNINSSGIFSGSAWSQNLGWIVFNCSTDNSCATQNIFVSTDWRPRSARPACNNATDDDNDGLTDYPADTGCDSLTDTSEVNQLGNGPAGGISPPGLTPLLPVQPVLAAIEPPTPTDIQPEPSQPPQSEAPVPPIVTPPESENSPLPPPQNVTSQSGGRTASPSGDVSPGGNIFNTIGAGISKGYKGAEKSVVQLLKIVQQVVSTPVAKVITKTTSTLGLITGGAGAISNALLGEIPFSEVRFILFRLWSLLLSFLGFRRKYRPWGTVYDSITKQPLDPAYVTLNDQFGKEITSAITDIDGRYGFLLEPGIYTIVANKTNYTFPSKKIAGRNQDELYSNLYFGEPFAVGTSGDVVIKNIPMDQDGFDWNEFAKRQKNFTLFYSKRDLWIQRIVNSFFLIGFISSVVALFAVPEPFNIIIFGFYIFFLTLRLTGLSPRSFGVVSEGSTGAPLSFAIVTIFSKALGVKIAQKVTNKFGKYYCLVPPGEYYLTIQRKNDDASYSLVHQTPLFKARRGLINSNIKI